MNAETWTLVDGHVHVHRQFSASPLLDAAAANLGLAAERLHNCKKCVGVLLPGTDPLPLSDQVTRVGSFGLAVGGSIPLEYPAAPLRGRLIELSSPATASPFGTPERISRFVSNQIRLRIHPKVA
jgi:hypothetical protein